jgi:hypothetical protein
MRGRPAGRFLGDMTTPRSPGEYLLQFLGGVFSQNFTLRVSIVRLLKYEHLHKHAKRDQRFFRAQRFPPQFF